MLCFEFTANDVLVVVTADCMLYLLKPKEESYPVVKQLASILGNVMIEGAKVHENSLIVLTNYKKAFVIAITNEVNATAICETGYGTSLSGV